MNWDYCEYRVGTHYLSALINDDWSGLEWDETEALECFISRVKDQWGVGHWSVSDDGEEFAMCHVSDLMATVETVQWNFRVK